MSKPKKLETREDAAAWLEELGLPDAASVVRDEDNCFEEIAEQAWKPHRERIIAALPGVEIPSAWAFHWADRIGDRAVMRARVTESEWVLYWARYIGPHPLAEEGER